MAMSKNSQNTYKKTKKKRIRDGEEETVKED